MNWTEAMEFYPQARAMAKTFAAKANEPDLAEDITQDLMLDLIRCDLSRATGNVKNYVNGVLWKAACSMLFQGRALRIRENTVSLDELIYLADRSGDRSGNPDVAHVRSLISST